MEKDYFEDSPFGDKAKNKEMSLKTVYELRDGRYFDNPDRSIVYEVCESLKEARREAPEYGDDTVIVKTVLRQIGERRFEEVSSVVVS
jgi:hypothetical protein